MAIHNQYNGFKYNEGRYNVQDLIVTLSDSVSPSDVRQNSFLKPMVDSMILVDALTKSITNKILTETVRFHDWLSLKLTKANPWSD